MPFYVVSPVTSKALIAYESEVLGLNWHLQPLQVI